MAFSKIFASIIVKILFGPWFSVTVNMERVRHRLGENYAFAGSLALFLLILAILFVIVGARKRGFRADESPLFSKFVIDGLLASATAGITGAFSNFLAIAFNHFSMPVTTLADGKNTAHLVWLTDWINANAWPLTRFLWQQQPGNISPGDMMLIISFLVLWWLILITFCYAVSSAIRSAFRPRS